MSAFDDAWSSISTAIGNTLVARNALDPVAQHGQWHALDDQMTQLENRRDTLAEAAISQALATLADAGALHQLQAITTSLNTAAQQIKDTGDKLAAVTQAVNAAGALVGFALKVAAA